MDMNSPAPNISTHPIDYTEIDPPVVFFKVQSLDMPVLSRQLLCRLPAVAVATRTW